MYSQFKLEITFERFEEVNPDLDIENSDEVENFSALKLFSIGDLKSPNAKNS